MLKDGDAFICKECGGTGKVREKRDRWSRRVVRRNCPVCEGDGKLDWIEKIVGKKLLNCTC